MADVLFLPGIVAPAATRYAPLLAELPGVHGVPKDLELYRETVPPEAYSIVIEVEGIDRAVDDEDFDRFDLYGTPLAEPSLGLHRCVPGPDAQPGDR